MTAAATPCSSRSSAGDPKAQEVRVEQFDGTVLFDTTPAAVQPECTDVRYTDTPPSPAAAELPTFEPSIPHVDAGKRVAAAVVNDFMQWRRRQAGESTLPVEQLGDGNYRTRGGGMSTSAAAELEIPPHVAFRMMQAAKEARALSCPRDLYVPGRQDYQAADRFQLQFHQSRHIIRAMFLGNGSGKTTVAGIEADYWLQHAHPFQRTPSWPIQVIWVTLKFQQMDMLRSQLEENCLTPGWRWNDNKHKYVWPSATVEAKRPLAHEAIADAVEMMLQQWLKDSDFGDQHQDWVRDALMGFGVMKVGMEPKQQWDDATSGYAVSADGALIPFAVRLPPDGIQKGQEGLDWSRFNLEVTPESMSQTDKQVITAL
jgi:hypothetical protein